MFAFAHKNVQGRDEHAATVYNTSSNGQMHSLRDRFINGQVHFCFVKERKTEHCRFTLNNCFLLNLPLHTSN
jgi:hypothetical protein